MNFVGDEVSTAIRDKQDRTGHVLQPLRQDDPSK